MNDQGAMMRLSIVVGAIHLILANLAMAWRLRAPPGALPRSAGSPSFLEA